MEDRSRSRTLRWIARPITASAAADPILLSTETSGKKIVAVWHDLVSVALSQKAAPFLAQQPISAVAEST
jgi:hypothetical protein